MDELIHADVFFFITSIAVVILTAVLVVLLIYLVGILKDVKYISRRFREEGDLISQDISELRRAVRNEGIRLKHFSDFFGKIYRRSKKGRKANT